MQWLDRTAKKWRLYFSVIRRYKKYLHKRVGLLFIALLLSIGGTAMRLIEPWPLKLIIDNVILGQPLPPVLAAFLPSATSGFSTLLIVLVGAILGIATIRGYLNYAQRVRAARLGVEVTAAMRVDLFNHLQSLSLAYHRRKRSGDLVVRLTSDIRILRSALISLPIEMVENVLLVIGLAVIMLIMDWPTGAVTLMMTPLIAVGVLRYRTPLKQAIRKQRKIESNLASVASETLAAIKVVQAFRGEQREGAKFGGASQKDRRTGVKAARIAAKLRWVSDFIVSLMIATVVLFATHRILSGYLSVGDMIVYMTYVRALARPMRRVSRFTERICRVSASGERVLQIFDIEPDIADRKGALDAPKFRGEVHFDNVSYYFKKTRAALDCIDLKIAPGEKVVIVGPTGAGKTTLVSLLNRFLDPDQGCVRIDGQDIREFKLDGLRGQIAIVLQESILFASTIYENIAYGKPDATPQQIQHVAERCNVDRIISALPDGYDTVLDEGGANLSGGQKQCIAIARAMIMQAPIVILDELTTGLDKKSAALVMNALEQLMQNSTVLMITHDTDMLRYFERAVMLKRGCIVYDGPPDRLRTSGRIRPPRSAAGKAEMSKN